MTDPEVPSETPEIPDKLYFRIGEVAGLLAVEPYVLRYWETEFPEHLQPIRTGGGQRRYRPEDIQTVFTIKRLLRDEMFSIPGARRYLAKQSTWAA